ncbi:MAG: PhnD/SsuA/transferrin family substrate-binding protein [Pseudomonadota bacterium]
MYDWPEVRPATHALWQAIVDAAGDHGVAHASGGAAPFVWQTCGLPFALGLSGAVHVVGTGAYRAAAEASDHQPGCYHSVVIAQGRSADAFDDERGRFAPFAGDQPLRCAVNSAHSQSGFAALLAFLRAQGPEDASGSTGDVIAPGPLGLIHSGAHRRSIALVASGAADIAAIDVVSWSLAQAHLDRRMLGRVKVIARTPSTPALPFVTPHLQAVTRLRTVLAEAIDGLGAEHAIALGLSGFVPRDASDYAPLAQRFEELRPHPRLRAEDP